MRYKVPQSIDMQDRIVGPLTLIQFMYVLIGGAICYAFFQLFSLTIFILLSLPVAILALALAFFKIQDQPFSKFIGAALGYFLKPKNLVWRRQPPTQTPNQPPSAPTQLPPSPQAPVPDSQQLTANNQQ